MERGELDALIEERVRYTVKYAAENSPFYRKWFERQGVNPAEIKTHEDLLDLPVISGKTIRENQPPRGCRIYVQECRLGRYFHHS